MFPLRAVAALFLTRQHLREPRSRRLTEGRLVQFASDAGGIQLDSINVIDRAHYLTVCSRFGPYDRRALDRLVYERRGEKAKAAQSYAQAKKLDPNYQPALDGLNRVKGA